MEVEAKVVGTKSLDPAKRLVIQGQSLTNGDFSGRELESMSVSGSHFVECSFERMRIGSLALGGGLEITTFARCSFDGSRFDMPTAGFVRFEACTFRDVNISHWGGDYVELVDCTFTGRLKSCMLWARPLAGEKRLESNIAYARRHAMPLPDETARALLLRPKNEMRGNDFSGLKLCDIDFRHGVDLSMQQLPVGPEYLVLPDAVASLARLTAAVHEWPEDEAQEVAGLLAIIERGLSEGQRQQFHRLHTFRRRKTEIIKRAFDFLR